ncbi:MAG TPA: hypothetical protein VHK69_22230 [Chitinophagaceae bacterium]|nr:hypothetical protein [Chitinophagaceae bacterium]
MKHSILRSLSFATLLSLLFSCSKENLTSSPSMERAPEVAAASAPGISQLTAVRLKRRTLLNSPNADFYYDSYGRLTKVVGYSDSTTYSYSGGYLTINKYFRPTKQLNYSMKGQLDSQGRLVNLKGTNSYGTVDAQYVYDVNGRLVQSTNKVPDGKGGILNGKTVYSWKNGDLVTETSYINTQLSQVNQFTYDLNKANPLNVYELHSNWVDRYLGVPNQHLRTKSVIAVGKPGQFTVNEFWTLNAQGSPVFSQQFSSIPLPFGLKSLDYQYYY